ncbi:MAG: Crp/Fnr family transcriptional regulator [Lagierella massiliensis]|nr:Crp/Fnr family transcriptional regulator [Lagierella massiliensis]
MLKTVKNINLFKSVEEEKLSYLIKKNEIYSKSYKQGITIYNENEKCTGIDIVLSGSLQAYSLSENGSSMILFEFPHGKTIGANLLFSPSNFYPHNIYCMTDSKVLHITKKAIEFLLTNFEFTLEFIKMLSANSNRLNHKISMVTQKTLRENLLDYLKQQSILQNSNPIILPISKKQLADLLGVRRPSLFRELKKLKEKGIVHVDNRKIYLNYL